MKLRTSTVRFPVITAFEIRRYQLYPREGESFARTLDRGVHVVVGINGLGKTTLLNALFRAVSGPKEWRSRPESGPAGRTPTTLSDWRNVDFFRSRVANDAEGATVTVTLAFGDDTLTVERSLQTLAVLRLVVNGAEIEAADQNTYQQHVTRLAGLRTFDAFFVILRYLLFFLENRPAVVWDENAQMDVLRVLFFDPAEAARVRELQDAIQSKDSDRRNRRVGVNRRAKKLAELRKRSATYGSVEAAVAALSTQMAALVERKEALGEELSQLDERRTNTRLGLEQAKIELQEQRRAYELAEQSHLSSIFPDLSEVGRYVVVHLRSGGGCLVCGNTDPAARDHVDECTAAGRCPVCDSTPEQQENVIPASVLSSARLELVEAGISKATEDVNALERSLSDVEGDYRSAVQALRRNNEEMTLVRDELTRHKATLPPSSEEIERNERLLADEQQELKEIRDDQRVLEEELTGVLQRGRQRVELVKEEIARHFTAYARYFLAEQCDLIYEESNRQVAEESIEFTFPRFTVRMSSSVFGRVRPRHDEDEVSESQKEFMDLAFRLALIKVAAGDSASMVVLETPEASLDSVFVDRAGRLLGEFASGGGAVGNRLIASSNLTKGGMVAALLGASPPDEEDPDPKARSYYIPVQRRGDRVINLLRVAAKNAALQQYEARYEVDLLEAVFPTWENPGRDDLPAV